MGKRVKITRLSCWGKFAVFFSFIVWKKNNKRLDVFNHLERVCVNTPLRVWECVHTMHRFLRPLSITKIQSCQIHAYVRYTVDITNWLKNRPALHSSFELERQTFIIMTMKKKKKIRFDLCFVLCMLCCTLYVVRSSPSLFQLSQTEKKLERMVFFYNQLQIHRMVQWNWLEGGNKREKCLKACKFANLQIVHNRKRLRLYLLSEEYNLFLSFFCLQNVWLRFSSFHNQHFFLLQTKKIRFIRLKKKKMNKWSNRNEWRKSFWLQFNIVLYPSVEIVMLKFCFCCSRIFWSLDLSMHLSVIHSETCCEFYCGNINSKEPVLFSWKLKILWIHRKNNNSMMVFKDCQCFDENSLV